MWKNTCKENNVVKSDLVTDLFELSLECIHSLIRLGQDSNPQGRWVGRVAVDGVVLRTTRVGRVEATSTARVGRAVVTLWEGKHRYMVNNVSHPNSTINYLLNDCSSASTSKLGDNNKCDSWFLIPLPRYPFFRFSLGHPSVYFH